MNEELAVGIIGTGWPGQQHAIALAEIPDVQLRSCADTNSERLRSFAETYRLESSFEDYQGLLRDRDLDAAIICLPNFLHFPVSLAALEAGKHVFCEKPPTMNAAEMKVLRDEAEKRGLIYFLDASFDLRPLFAPPATSSPRDAWAKFIARAPPGSVRVEFPQGLVCGSPSKNARVVVRLSTLACTRSILSGI